jgi:hypothetical protein
MAMIIDNDRNKEIYIEKVMANINILNCTGLLYRKKVYRMVNIIDYYKTIMIMKYSKLGKYYLDDMEKNINKIFMNVSSDSSYEIIEFVNLVIKYYFKCVAFKYNLTKDEPQVPDYILSEIKDMASQIKIR